MTNQKRTFFVLDEYFEENGQLKMNYLHDMIIDQMDCVQRSQNAGNGESALERNLKNKHRSIQSIVWDAFMQMADAFLKDYSGENPLYTCTSEQLKKWLAKYGYTPNFALRPVIEEVGLWREELLG